MPRCRDPSRCSGQRTQTLQQALRLRRSAGSARRPGRNTSPDVTGRFVAPRPRELCLKRSHDLVGEILAQRHRLGAPAWQTAKSSARVKVRALTFSGEKRTGGNPGTCTRAPLGTRRRRGTDPLGAGCGRLGGDAGAAPTRASWRAANRAPHGG